MAHFRMQIVGTLILCASSSVWAASVEECRDITNPSERLACYDNTATTTVISAPAPKQKPEKQPAQPITPAPTRSTKPKQTNKPVVVNNALEEPLPRRGVNKPQVETAAVEYTIVKVLRRYGEKIEYQTNDGRRFRKLSATQTNFSIGDTVVAKLGVFGAVFLINQDGTRIKVKPLN